MDLSDSLPALDKGLGKVLEMPDPYAILGVPLTCTEIDPILRNYQAHAARLKLRLNGHGDRAVQATVLFSKLVSPAKETLTDAKAKVEYDTVLSLNIKHIIDNIEKYQNTITQELYGYDILVESLECDERKLDQTYENLQKPIACKLYKNLNTIKQNITILSQLNLTYLLLKQGYRKSGVVSSVTGFPPTLARSIEEELPMGNGDLPNWRIAFEQAKALHQRGLDTQALRLINASIRDNPQEREEAFLLRARIYRSLQMLGMAVNDYRKALSLNPGSYGTQQEIWKLEAIRKQNHPLVFTLLSDLWASVRSTLPKR